MRIALVFASYSPKSTYIETPLSKALARLGHDVHIVTSGLPTNYHLSNYTRDFARAFGAATQPLGTTAVEGVTVHRLPHRIVRGHVALTGLRQYLKQLSVDVVQTGTVIAWPTMETAFYQPFLGYRLFTGAHQAAEIAFTTRGAARWFGLHRRLAILARTIPGRLVSLVTERCYAVTEDAADVARELYGVQAKKIEIAPLGFDDQWFHLPARDDLDRRATLRATLGFEDGDIVCVYTGRFDNIKQPAFLAKAIAALRAEGLPFRGLFVGGGEQADLITASDGSMVHGYVPADELAPFYWASDLAAWPRGYSASQVEAIACGLPVVMTDESQKKELDGFVVKYRQLDLRLLIDALRRLADPDARRAISVPAATHVHAMLSWDTIAKHRTADYSSALARHAQSG